MALNETTFDELTLEERKIAFAVYNKTASCSLDFKAKILSEDDDVLFCEVEN